jgi:hypothetical protein
MEKTTEQKVKERIDFVLDCLNKNMAKEDIKVQCIKKFNVTDKQVETYIVEANKTFKKSVKPKKKDAPEALKKAKRLEEIKVLKRIIEIQNLLLECKPTYEILQLITEKHGISESQVNKDIRKAKLRIVKRVRAQEKTAYEDAVARREHLYVLALDEKSYKTALAIDDSRAKIQGLFTENIKLTGDSDNPVEVVLSKLSDDQLIKLKEAQEALKDASDDNTK